ncbi:MAG: phosphoserine phosphatase SerB [Halobacteria archaeon]
MLVAFDFDGTLSDSEMTVLLGEEAGVSERIADITELAMNDEIGYAESLRERVGLLEGMRLENVERAFERVKLRDEAADVIRELSRADRDTAILTGGFKRGVSRALEKADVDVDHIVANSLEVENGALTGKVDGRLVEGTKDDALEMLAVETSTDLDETVAVGDGANDLPMLQVSGLAVGYEPKSAVRPHSDEVVGSMNELKLLFEQRGIL